MNKSIKTPVLSVFMPNLKQVAQGVAINTIIKYGVGIRKNTPLQVTDEDFNVTANQSQYLGTVALTSLQLTYNEKDQAPKTVVLIDCVMAVSQEKQIVTTALEGRDGTIKEYISKGDYCISVSASVSTYNEKGSDGDYPKEALKELLDILDKKTALDCQSDWLNLFDVENNGIKSVVVKNYSVAQETFSNRQTISFDLLSDTPYEIKLNQDAAISK